MPPNNPGHSILNKGEDGRRFLTQDFGEVNSSAPPRPDLPPFQTTREHRRFTEFAAPVRAHRYIGLCWGPPGVGKTLSARHYGGIDEWEQWHSLFTEDLGPVPPRVLEARTAFFTPTVAATTKQIDQGLPRVCQKISFAVDFAEHGVVDPYVHTESRSSGRTELLIIDEADRLKTTGLEQVRDFYDHHHMGVILIGMPGIEKRLARYPQLYSRIGFAHEYRQLTGDELTAVLTTRLPATEGATDGGVAHATAVATIVRITGGNFRLVDRLLTQIERVQTVNGLDALTPEVVEAARDALLIGWTLGKMRPKIMAAPVKEPVKGESKPLISDETLHQASPSWRRAAVIVGIGLPLWLGPVAAAFVLTGAHSIFTQQGLFFSGTALVTFGGAYAVLAFVAQQAVETYGWLAPGEMVRGLAMAETTPGPLIMVVQFVAFLGAFRASGSLDPWTAAILASVLTTWVTFVPCFLFIFLGAPHVERLRGNQSLSSALTGITAAVVGVIANLALYFATHTLFAQTNDWSWGPINLDAPELASLQPSALLLMIAAMVMIFALRWSVLRTLGVCAVAGLGLGLLI